jgi:hypothetical protein
MAKRRHNMNVEAYREFDGERCEERTPGMPVSEVRLHNEDQKRLYWQLLPRRSFRQA